MASIRTRTSTSGEKTWAVLYRHNGRQTSDTFPVKKKAAEFKSLVEILGRDAALAAINRGVAPTTGITVAELSEAFLEWKARDVTERTHADYRRDVTNWILPTLGHRPAEAIDEADVQRWVDHMARTLSPKSVTDRHMILHSMYEYGRAKSRRLVTHNPCQETSLPKRGKKKPPKGTTVAEYQALLQAAANRNPDARDLILFLGSTGWRWSEAAALSVRSVDDEGTDVWVTVGRVFRLDGHGRQVLVEDEAKSHAGFRRIRVGRECAAMIRRRIVGKALSDLLFLNSRERPWNQNTWLRETWPAICKDAGLEGDRRPTPHWLRHMHVAVAIAGGASLPELQRRIGHENISTTIGVYGGMIGDVSTGSLTRMDDILAGKAGVVGEVVSGEVITQVLELD